MSNRERQLDVARFLAVLVCIVAFSSCNQPPQSRPADSEFVGDWGVPPSDLTLVKQYFKCRVQDCKLTLRPNGVCEAKNVPLVHTSAEGRLEYLCRTRSGTWRVEKKQFWILTLLFDNSGYSFEVHERGRGFELVEFFVDPDNASYRLVKLQ